jgi:hypothetical protein
MHSKAKKNGECTLPVTLRSAQFHKSTLQTKKMKQNQMENKNMKRITNITYPAFALLALACFALSPHARAVCQQGCDLNLANTFLGDDALINSTTGGQNTATGYDALFHNTTGGQNTATGYFALFSNNGGYNTQTVMVRSLPT